MELQRKRDAANQSYQRGLQLMKENKYEESFHSSLRSKKIAPEPKEEYKKACEAVAKVPYLLSTAEQQMKEKNYIEVVNILTRALQYNPNCPSIVEQLESTKKLEEEQEVS